MIQYVDNRIVLFFYFRIVLQFFKVIFTVKTFLSVFFQAFQKYSCC